jgi:hypothetical protein
MKTKFFFLLVLFLAIGAASFAQSTTTDTEKKDASAPVVTTDQQKAGECSHHDAMTAQAGCTFVDADKDGKCDTCGKTAEECKEKCKAEATPTKGCDPAACGAKEGEKSSCCPSKGGKK